MQDKDVDCTGTGARIGAAIKGAEAKDIEKGVILCTPGQARCGSSISLTFRRNRFYQGDINGRKCHGQPGWIPCR